MTTQPTAPARAFAVVATDAGERYAKQLASHLGRRTEVTELPDGYRIQLSAGTGDVVVRSDHLLLEASAADDAHLGVVKDVIGGHLERFGQRRELVVTWQQGLPPPSGEHLR